MAEQNADGTFKAADGSNHVSEGTANARTREYMSGGGGGSSGGFEMGALGLIFKMIFLILPMLLAKLFGWVVGLILKLGVVGRVILTAFAGFLVFMIMAIFMSTTPLSGSSDDAKAIAVIKDIVVFVCDLAPAVLVGIWFWRKNYPVIKEMPFDVFSKIATLAFAVGGYSIVILAVLFGGILRVGGEGNDIGIGLGILIGFAAAFVIYFLKTRSYTPVPEAAEEAAAEAE